MKNKKILVVSHMYPRENRNNYGTFVSDQVSAIAKIISPENISVFSPVQYTPWLISKVSNKWKQYKETEKSKKDPSGVLVFFPRYLCLPRKMLRSLAAWSCFLTIVRNKKMKKIIKNSDVIVAHTALFDGWLAKIIAKKFNKKYIVVIHGEDIFQNTYGFRNFFRRFNLKRTLTGAKKIITVSFYMKKAISNVYGMEDKIEVLHNGVDLMLFNPGSKKFNKKTKTISAGFLIPRKANEYVLRSLAKLKKEGIDFEHTIAGDGPEKQKLEKLTRDLKIDDRVNFIGSYEHKNFPRILSDRDLFILPSWDEAFGVVYIEAMAMGLPVIAANDAGVVDIISESVDGYLVLPKNIIELKNKIKNYARLSSKEKQEISKNALKKSKKFTWSKNAEKLIEILRSI